MQTRKRVNPKQQVLPKQPTKKSIKKVDEDLEPKVQKKVKKNKQESTQNNEIIRYIKMNMNRFGNIKKNQVLLHFSDQNNIQDQIQQLVKDCQISLTLYNIHFNTDQEILNLKQQEIKDLEEDLLSDLDDSYLHSYTTQAELKKLSFQKSRKTTFSAQLQFQDYLNILDKKPVIKELNLNWDNKFAIQQLRFFSSAIKSVRSKKKNFGTYDNKLIKLSIDFSRYKSWRGRQDVYGDQLAAYKFLLKESFYVAFCFPRLRYLTIITNCRNEIINDEVYQWIIQLCTQIPQKLQVLKNLKMEIQFIWNMLLCALECFEKSEKQMNKKIEQLDMSFSESKVTRKLKTENDFQYSFELKQTIQGLNYQFNDCHKLEVFLNKCKFIPELKLEIGTDKYNKKLMDQQQILINYLDKFENLQELYLQYLVDLNNQQTEIISLKRLKYLKEINIDYVYLDTTPGLIILNPKQKQQLIKQPNLKIFQSSLYHLDYLMEKEEIKFNIGSVEGKFKGLNYQNDKFLLNYFKLDQQGIDDVEKIVKRIFNQDKKRYQIFLSIQKVRDQVVLKKLIEVLIQCFENSRLHRLIFQFKLGFEFNMGKEGFHLLKKLINSLDRRVQKVIFDLQGIPIEDLKDEIIQFIYFLEQNLKIKRSKFYFNQRIWREIEKDELIRLLQLMITRFSKNHEIVLNTSNIHGLDRQRDQQLILRQLLVNSVLNMNIIEEESTKYRNSQLLSKRNNKILREENLSQCQIFDILKSYI